MPSVPAAIGQDDDMDAKALVAKAGELAKAEKYDQAVALMKMAIKVEPDNDAYLGTISDFEYTPANTPTG